MKKKVKKYIEYFGTLDTHWETGYEDGIFAHLYRDGFETKNEKYNSNDPNSGPEYYRNYEGMVSIDTQDEVEIIDCKVFPEMNGKKFLIGRTFPYTSNPFGRTYPINKNFDINKWHKMFQSGTTRAKVSKLIKTIAFYGGTFDPVHKGHESIIENLKYRYDLVIIVPGNNWTKRNQPLFPIDQRINSLIAVCKKFKNVEVLDIAKIKKFNYTINVAKEIEKRYGASPHIVIGSDNVLNIEKWKRWDILKQYQFLVIKRPGNDSLNDFKKFDKSPILLDLPVEKGSIPLSSTMIRSNKDTSLIPEEALKELDLKLLYQKETDMIKK